MTPLASLVDPTLVARLGWTLVHSIWQGAIIASVTAVLLSALRGARPQIRYLLACVSLLAMVASAAITFTLIQPAPRAAAFGAAATPGETLDARVADARETVLDASARAARGTQAGVTAGIGSTSVEAGTGSTTPMARTAASGVSGAFGAAATSSRAVARGGTDVNPATGGLRREGALTRTAGSPGDAFARSLLDAGAWQRAALMIERLLPQFVALWIAGLMVCSIRLLGALALVEHLKRHQARPMPPEWQQRVAALARRMRVRGTIRVRASVEARTAAVIGWLRPVILVPAGALAGLTTQQLEAVLAHELAHIRRHDYLVNLLQSLAETVFFYHPAVWYISRCIRTEREHCCDDEAVAVVGDAVTYACALTDLELLRQGTPALAMAANGGSLLRRIQRLLAPSTDTAPSWSTATSLLGVAIAIFALASARGSIAASLQSSGTPALASSTAESAEQRDTPRPATTRSTQGRRTSTPARASDWDDLPVPPAPPEPPAPAAQFDPPSPPQPPQEMQPLQPPQPPQPATSMQWSQPPQPPQAPQPLDPLEPMDVPPAPAAPRAPYATPMPPVPPARYFDHVSSAPPAPGVVAVPPVPYVGTTPPVSPAPLIAPAPSVPATPAAAPAAAVPPAPHTTVAPALPPASHLGPAPPVPPAPRMDPALAAPPAAATPPVPPAPYSITAPPVPPIGAVPPALAAPAAPPAPPAPSGLFDAMEYARSFVSPSTPAATPALARPSARAYAGTPMPAPTPVLPAPRSSSMAVTPMPPRPANAQAPAAPQPATPPPPPPPEVGGIERAMNWIGSWFGNNNGTNTWSWNDNGHRFTIRSTGSFEITDDDLDIKSVTPGGYVTLEERLDGVTTRVEVRNTADGQLQRAFYRNGQAIAWEPDGRAWLAKKIPDLVRRTGFGAEGRVRRILARQGPTGVLDEVTRIPSSYVKRIYLERLMTETTLPSPLLARLLTQAGKEITSDYERATLLIRVAKSGQMTTDEARLAYATATMTINSSYEHRRALEAFVQTGPLSEPALKTALDSAARIESDYELATLLIPIGKQQSLTPGVMDAYVGAAQTINSDYELRRALTPLITQPAPVSPSAMKALFHAVSGIDSDYELAMLLIELVNRQKLDESTKIPFFQAVDTIQSDYERGRVLKALVSHGAIGDSLALGVIESTHRMNSAYEAANVLKGVASSQPLDGALRKAYITAAERLQSAHERDGALVVLVRNEVRAK